MEIIRRITPEEEYNAGLVIFRQGGVHPLEDENGFLRYAVDGDPRRIVRVGATTKLSGRCSCDFFGNVHKPCRHLAAAMMQAISTGAIEEMRRRRARENAGALMGTLQSALPMETPLEMEITLRLLGEREPVRVSLRVGQERMYVVKSMAQFLRGLQEKTAIAFGKGFVLEPEWMGFTGVDAKIIKLLQDAAYVCQLEGKLVQTGLDAKYLTVADRFVPRLMQLLMARPFKISFGEEVVSVPSVFDGQVELLFGVFASGRELEVRAQMPKSLRMLDSECTYVYCEGDVLRLPEAQRGIVRVLLSAQAGPGAPAAFCRYEIAAYSSPAAPTVTAFYRTRIVKNDGSAVWKGRVHECLPRYENALTEPENGFCVRHLGSEKPRGSRKLDIYRAQISEKEPLSPRDLFYYGRELFYHGFYTEADAIEEKFIARPDGWDVNKIEDRKIQSACREATGDEAGAADALFSSFSYGAPRAGVLCALGRIFKRKNDFSSAYFWYLSAYNAKDHSAEGDFENPDERGAIPLIEAVYCAYSAGEKAEARKLHEECMRLYPDHPAVKYNEAFFDTHPD